MAPAAAGGRVSPSLDGSDGRTAEAGANRDHVGRVSGAASRSTDGIGVVPDALLPVCVAPPFGGIRGDEEQSGYTAIG
jgi:hypothetical protein